MQFSCEFAEFIDFKLENDISKEGYYIEMGMAKV